MTRLPKTASTFVIAMLVGLTGGCAVPPGHVWNEGDPRVFASVDTPETPALLAEEWVIRHEVVTLNDRLFREDGLQLGDTISISIFNERSLTGGVDRVETVADHRNVRARLLPPEQGHILLTIGAHRVNGNVQWHTRGRIFYLRFAPDIGAHVFVEVDPEKEDILPPSPPVIPPGN
jgi:hypothetical protein